MRNCPPGEQKHIIAILSPVRPSPTIILSILPEQQSVFCGLTISQDDHEVAPLRGAESDSAGVVSDHDQPPDGQHQGVPDGHPVQDQREVDVEQ